MDLTISINEARKPLGDNAQNMSDSEVEMLIRDLDTMARYALKEAQKIRQEASITLG